MVIGGATARLRTRRHPIEQTWGSLKSKELANLCSDTIDQVAQIAKDGLDRIGADAALCLAFLRHCGLRL